MWEPLSWLSSAIEKQTLALAKFGLGFETPMSFEKVQISSTGRLRRLRAQHFSEVGKGGLARSQKVRVGKFQSVRSEFIRG